MGPWKFQLDTDAYPRFKHFRKRLQSIVPRLYRLTEKGRLAAFVSQGTKTLQAIQVAARYLQQQELTVLVIGNDVKIPSNFKAQFQLNRVGQMDKPFRQSHMPTLTRKEASMEITEETHPKLKPVASEERLLGYHLTKESVSASNVMEIMKHSTKFHPNFIVCLMTSMSKQEVKRVFEEFSAMDRKQQENVIVYDIVKATNFSYKDLIDAEFDSQRVKLGSRNNHLGEQLQFLLEDRVTEVLESIVQLSGNLAPKSADFFSMNLTDECSQTVLSSLSCQHVVNDLDPDKVQGQDQDSKVTMDISKSRNGDTFSEHEKNELFHKLLLDFLTKKSKCCVCENLSKKYGIPVAVANELMNEDYFDYDKLYLEHVKNEQKPSWSEVKSGRSAALLNYRYIMKQRSLFDSVEVYFKEIVKLLVRFEKLRFEVFGLLRKVQVMPDVKVPEYPKLPKDLQKELLSLPYVVGCGTIYGKLTVHVKRDDDSMQFKFSEIKKVLERHSYCHSFTVQTFVDQIFQAGGFHEISHGCALKAEVLDELRLEIEQDSKFGTLGCFVCLRALQQTDFDKFVYVAAESQAASKDGATGKGGVEGQSRVLKAFQDIVKDNDTSKDEANLEDKQTVEDIDIGESESVGENRGAGEGGFRGKGAVRGEGRVAGEGGPAGRLFGITCDHCVRDCKQEVHVDVQCTFEPFGLTTLSSDRNKAVDIAAILVNDSSSPICNVYIEDRKWEFCQEGARDIVADNVIKHGCVTERTEGIIISDNYVSNNHGYNRVRVLQEDTYYLDKFFTILIEGIPGNSAAQSLFDTDSGTDEDPLLAQEATEDENDRKLRLVNLEATDTKDSVNSKLRDSPVQISFFAQADNKKNAVMEFESVDAAVQNYKHLKENNECVRFVGRKSKDLDTRRVLVEKNVGQVEPVQDLLNTQYLKNLSEEILDVKLIFKPDGSRFALLEFNKRSVASDNCTRLNSNTPGLRFKLMEPKDKFSENGDSGAVIYWDGLVDSTEVIQAISLLCGGITIWDTFEGDIQWTYSSHLKKSLDALCGDEYEIEMPWNAPGILQ